VTFTIDAPDVATVSAYQTRPTISPTAGACLYGWLTDQTTGQPLAGRTVSVLNSFIYHGQATSAALGATTNSSGTWMVCVSTSHVKARMLWQAFYSGESGIDQTQSAVLTLRVRPRLSTASSAHWNGRAYTITQGVTFTLKGASQPNMAGKTLTVQYKPYGGRWHPTIIHPLIHRDGSYAVKLTFSSPGRVYLRFAYTGSTTGPWLSTTSPARLFVVS
jgi:hypothetical protein